MRLLAFAVMSNHLHILIQQGDRKLKSLMQPLLRRLAVRLQRAHGIVGPVFWRPYGSEPCFDPEHARNTITYINLNPVRAGICTDPADYAWTSHALYAGTSSSADPSPLDPIRPVLDPSVALPLFAATPGRPITRLHGDYLEVVRLRLERDRLSDTEYEVAGGGEGQMPARRSWSSRSSGGRWSPLFHAPAGYTPRDPRGRRPASTPDLSALAKAVLAAEAPGMPVAAIRGRGGGPRFVRLRHQIVRRLHAAGFRNVEIARYLDLSESAVSYVIRKGIPETPAD